MGMRYYAPESGTFLSADPLGHAACMDLYSYCNGDPVNNLDPDGRFGKGAASAVGDRLSGIWGAVSNPLDTVTGIGSGLMDAGETLWGGRSDVLGMLEGGFSGLGDGFQKLGTQFSSAKGIGEFYGGATFDFALGAGLAKGIGVAGEAASSLRTGLTSGIEAAEGGANLGVMGRRLERLGYDQANTTRILDSIQNGEQVVIVGENMKRVNAVAKMVNNAGGEAVTYEPRNLTGASRNSLEANRSWIRYWAKEKGATVIDIGRQATPRPTGPSLFYGIENRSLNRWGVYTPFSE
jgi:hypothetical protein